MKTISILAIILSLLFISAGDSSTRLNTQTEKWSSFISDCHLLLIGEVPDSAYIASFQKHIINDKQDEKAIKTRIISKMMNTPEFYKHIEGILREDYLEDLSKTDFIEIHLKDIYQLDEVRKESVLWNYYDNYFKNTFEISQIMSNKTTSDVDIQKLQYLLLDNFIYELIHRGPNNFVTSTFQHFIRRLPTKHELSVGIQMLGGEPATLFGQVGYGKTDYIHILFNNSAYWENQIVFWFNVMLNRDPSQEELVQYLPIMEKWRVPEKVIQAILVNNIQLQNEKSDQQTQSHAVKKDKDVIALTYFKIFNSSIPNTKLENYVALLNGFGDKDLLKDMIYKDWTFNTQPELDDSTRNLLLNTQVLYQSNISDKKNIEEVFSLINFYAFNEIVKIKDFSFFNDGQRIAEKLYKLCPNLCADNIETTDKVQEAVIMTSRALKYPDEVEKLIQYYQNATKGKKEKTKGLLYSDLKYEVFEKYPMLKYYFEDVSITQLLNERESRSGILPLEEIHKNINKYVDDTYSNLLSRKPTSEENAIWYNYYNNENAMPGMIYYTIISSDEYKYL